MENSVFQISGQIVDIVNSRIFKGTVYNYIKRCINTSEGTFPLVGKK